MEGDHRVECVINVEHPHSFRQMCRGTPEVRTDIIMISNTCKNNILVLFLLKYQ